MATFIDGPHVDFALRLHDARTRNDMTQEDLAQAIKVHRRTISEYENGRMFPRGNTLKRLAEILGVDAVYLALGHHPKTLEFMSAQRAQRDISGVAERVEMLLIEHWENLGAPKSDVARVQYNANPSRQYETSDLSRFFPIIARFGDGLRAVRYPESMPRLVDYSPGAVVVFGPALLPQHIESDADVICVPLSDIKAKPQIWRLFRGSQLTEPMLVSLDPECRSAPRVADPTEIHIVGFVVGTWNAARQ